MQLNFMVFYQIYHVCCRNKENAFKINDDSYNVVTMTRAQSHRTQVRDTDIVTPGDCVTSSALLSRVIKNEERLGWFGVFIR